MTVLPAVLREPLRRHLERVKALFERDVRGGGGFVAIPGALGRKYPGVAREWAWQWVFPARRRAAAASSAPVGGAAGHQAGGAAGGHHPAGHAARVAAFVCDASAGRGLRYPDGAGVAGACRREHDDDLHARAEPGWARSGQPGRSALGSCGCSPCDVGCYRGGRGGVLVRPVASSKVEVQVSQTQPPFQPRSVRVIPTTAWRYRRSAEHEGREAHLKQPSPGARTQPTALRALRREMIA